jgi:hypothetical protein
MQTQLLPTEKSFQYGDSPTVFGDIFEVSTSLVCWQRPENRIVKAYFEAVSSSLKIGVRNVFSLPSLHTELASSLPDGIGKEHAIKDIYLLADMLTCLFDCKEVGLRLTAINTAMCPRLHVDNIPVRLITTYVGPGTEWLPNEHVEQSNSNLNVTKVKSNQTSLRYNAQNIKQLNSFDVSLIKGSAWGEDHIAAIHRSCALASEQWRVVLTLDPI